MLILIKHKQQSTTQHNAKPTHNKHKTTQPQQIKQAVATLEGIALLGDPQYQMVAQAYPFVARRVLKNDASGAGALLRDLLYDSTGQLRPARLSALLQAALGHVAARAEGFVDLDALPDDGAPPREVLRFVLSPEAADLRPLLVSWLATGADLLLRDRARKALALAPGLAPRLPLIGALPLPPAPPLFVPGRGLVPLDAAVDMLAPPLDAQEGVYLQSLLELAAGVLGVPAAQLDAPDASMLFNLLARPGDQARELAEALQAVAGDPSAGAAAAGVAADVADAVAAALAARAGVDVDTLFPLRAPVLERVRAGFGGGGAGGGGAAAPASPLATQSWQGSVEGSVEDGGDGSGFDGAAPARPAAAAAAAAPAGSSGGSGSGGSGRPGVAMRPLGPSEAAAAAAAAAPEPVRR